MAIGELVTRLTCDSSNFDNNIRRSQREIQEFRRRTERESAVVNNAFNRMGSVIGNVNPQLGSLIGSLGQVAPLVAAGTAAFGLFKQVIQQSETAMDELNKKTAQLNGAWEHITTTIGNGNMFNGLVSSLRDAVDLAGRLEEIMDNIGTLGGYYKLNKSDAEANLAELKKMIKAGASKEAIKKQVEKTKTSIVKFDVDSKETVHNLEEAYRTELKSVYTKVKGKGYIGVEAGTNFIEKIATDWKWRENAESWSDYFKKTNIDQLKNNKNFENFLRGSRLYDDYLFKDFNRGGSEGKKYIKDVKSIIINTLGMAEEDWLVPLQELRITWKDTEREASEMHSNFYKRLNETLEKPGKGGGSVYTSKQEAPKERTLQDILDDLDKSLVINRLIGENKGDVTRLDFSSLERTANELKNLIKNTTDEEQRKQILSILKTINNIINKPKEVKNPANNDNDFKGIYGNEIGNLSLNNQSRIYELERKIKDLKKEIKLENILRAEASLNRAIKGIKLKDIISAESAESYNYNADEFLKDKVVGEPSNINILKESVQSLFDDYKKSREDIEDIEDIDASLEKALKLKVIPINILDNRIKSFIPFGNLSKLDIPIKYPEEFYFASLASSKFSSGVSSIVKKFTGFDSFRRDFAKNAYSEFDRLISEGTIIKPEDVNKILYQVYLDTIKKHIDNTPDFFKNSSDFIGFINDKTSFRNDSKTALKLGKENVNTLLYQELLSSIVSPKAVEKDFESDDLSKFNNSSKTIKSLNFTPEEVIDLVEKISKGNIYAKAEILKVINSALVERRELLTNYYTALDPGVYKAELNESNKRLRLIQLEKEKRSNKGVLPDDKLKEYEELMKETLSNYTKFSDEFLKIEEDRLNKAVEDQKKLIEGTKANAKSLEDKINQTDDIGNRVQREEEENNVLRERQKELKELSNNYMSVADSAYKISAAFSTLDNKFGDVAGVLLNVVGITAEAIGKLIGMATAQGVSNAFKLPWPQNLAAVATVVAAGASAAGQIAGLASRKYATGGIVSGPGTSISDSIPIRVSNGEMILNKSQQRNLFDLLNYGGGSSRGGGTSEVNFKILGENLVGSINNRNKGRNKIL